MLRTLSIYLLLILPLLTTACSDDENRNTPSGKHIWKNQTDSLKQAEETAAELNETLQLKQQQLQDRGK